MAGSKYYLDYEGLQYLIDKYIINKQIGTTPGDMLYVSSVTNNIPTYSKVGGTIGNHQVPMAAIDGSSNVTVSWTTISSSWITYAIGSAPAGTPTNVEEMLNYLNTNKGDMNNPMNAQGDIIYGGSAGTPTRLPKGTDGQVLKLVSGIPAWSSDSNTNYYHTPSYTSGGLKIGTGVPSGSLDDMYVPYATSSSVGVMYLALGNDTGAGMVLDYTNGAATLYGPQFDSDQFLIQAVTGQSYKSLSLRTITTTQIDALFA